MREDLINQTLLNRYSIHNYIGSGGMAEVYKVWDAQRAVFLAMKLLREDFAEDVIFLRRFRREAKILSELQHPHIVRFYGLEQDGPLAFILMDFVQGYSLRREIFTKRKKISFTQILETMRPVCSALNYAHKQGMVHCDVKPGNILIDQFGQIFVTDFGLSRMIDSAASTLVGIGTPNYMAPEQVRCLNPTPPTDIYALGVVLFELLTGGERPFTGERAKSTAIMGEKIHWEHLHLEPPSPREYNPAVTPELESVVLKCLEKLPENRYQNPLELLNGLEFGLTGLVEEKYMSGQGGALSPSSPLFFSGNNGKTFSRRGTSSFKFGSREWSFTWNFGTIMGLVGIISLLLTIVIVMVDFRGADPPEESINRTIPINTLPIVQPTETQSPTVEIIIAPEITETPEPSHTSTLTPSSTTTFTHTPSPTIEVVVLKGCGNLYYGERFEYPDEICVYAVGSSPQFVTIIFPVSPPYEVFLEVSSDRFECLLPRGYPERFFCTGPAQPELTPQQVLLYRYDNRLLLGQGSVIFPSAETPVPTKDDAPDCDYEGCEDNQVPKETFQETATQEPTIEPTQGD